MKKLILVILLVVSLGACNEAPTDYVTQEQLDIAISQCVAKEDLNDYVLQIELDDYVKISSITMLQKQVYLNSDNIMKNNSSRLMEIFILQDKVNTLEYDTR